MLLLEVTRFILGKCEADSGNFRVFRNPSLGQCSSRLKILRFDSERS